MTAAVEKVQEETVDNKTSPNTESAAKSKGVVEAEASESPSKPAKHGVPSTITSATAARAHHAAAAATIDKGLEILNDYIAKLNTDKERGVLSEEFLKARERDTSITDVLDGMIAVIDERSKPSVEFILGVLGAESVPEPLLERQRSQGARALVACVRNRSIARKREAAKAAKRASIASAAATALAKEAAQKAAQKAAAEKEAAEKEAAEKEAAKRALKEAAAKRALSKESGDRDKKSLSTTENKAMKDSETDIVSGKKPKHEKVHKETPNTGLSVDGDDENDSNEEVTRRTSDVALDYGKKRKVGSSSRSPSPESSDVQERSPSKSDSARKRSSSSAEKKKISTRQMSTRKVQDKDKSLSSKAETPDDSDNEITVSAASSGRPGRRPGRKPTRRDSAKDKTRTAEKKASSVPSADQVEKSATSEKPKRESAIIGKFETSRRRRKARGSAKSSRASSPSPSHSHGSDVLDNSDEEEASTSKIVQAGKSSTKFTGEKDAKAREESEDDVDADEVEPGKPLETAVATGPGSKVSTAKNVKQEESTPKREGDKKGAKPSPKSEPTADGAARPKREKRASLRRISLTGEDKTEQVVHRTRLRRESSHLEGVGSLALGGDPFMALCYKAWEKINADKISIPFREPVTARDAPGYFDVIKKPMDLSTVLSNLQNGNLATPPDFLRDMVLICRNAMHFNGRDSDLYDLATELKQLIKSEVDPIVQKWRDAHDSATGEIRLDSIDLGPSPVAGTRYPSRRASWRYTPDEGPPSPKPVKRKPGRGRKRVGGAERVLVEHTDDSEDEPPAPPPARRGGRGRRLSRGPDRHPSTKEREREKERSGASGRGSKRGARSVVDEEPREDTGKRRRIGVRRRRADDD